MGSPAPSVAPSAPGAPSSLKTGPALRGMATASFCLGCWSDLTFWWYPFGLSVAVVAVVLGLITLALGVRAGREGQNLALGGVLLGANAFFMAATVYRGMQFFFEGITPLLP
jgi:hypothetical protein